MNYKYDKETASERKIVNMSERKMIMKYECFYLSLTAY